MTEYDDPIVGGIMASVSFPVDVECEGYPDVLFDIMFEKRSDQFMAEQSVSALEQYMYSYNEKHFFNPIHYISDIDSLPEASSAFSVCIHMDFGNADPEALIGAVKALAETNLPIRRVVLE